LLHLQDERQDRKRKNTKPMRSWITTNDRDTFVEMLSMSTLRSLMRLLPFEAAMSLFIPGVSWIETKCWNRLKNWWMNEWMRIQVIRRHKLKTNKLLK
jgi:hypothetical protein